MGVDSYLAQVFAGGIPAGRSERREVPRPRAGHLIGKGSIMATTRKSLGLPPMLSLLTLLILGAAAAGPAFAGASTLRWSSPASSSSVRIGRRAIGSSHGAVKVYSGSVKTYCKPGTSGADASSLECKLPKVDPAYQYFICTRSQAGEIIGGLDCSYHGNGGGWECTPTDTGAGWCD